MKTLDESLRSLGSTPDEVAEACRKAGVKGRPENCHECPVARLLGSQGFRNVNVGTVASTGRGRSSALGNLEFGTNPPSVIAFIERFDKGKYPDLLQPEAS